jgi:luciferase family oxidoreductase group 1
MTLKLSVLDTAPVFRGTSVTSSLQAILEYAQAAERHGYSRIWYAEHHNTPDTASAATPVIISHVAAHTESIRVGAGGVMLPNHPPLIVAEQFGTLEGFYPGRIDLGLGRIAGSNKDTMEVLRRSTTTGQPFQLEVQELQGFLGDESTIPGIAAVPGAGSHVPLYILGASTFGAKVASRLGLPYSFASHFGTDALEESASLAEPYVIASVNVIAVEDAGEANGILEAVRRERMRTMLTRTREYREYSDEQLDQYLASDCPKPIANMMECLAVGNGDDVRAYLEDFVEVAHADELILSHRGTSAAERLNSLVVTANAMSLTAV